MVQTYQDSFNKIGKATSKLKERMYGKGQEVNKLPENYTVIDIETTGLSPTMNEIIQLSALKIKNDKIAEIENHGAKGTFLSFNNFYELQESLKQGDIIHD